MYNVNGVSMCIQGSAYASWGRLAKSVALFVQPVALVVQPVII